MTNVASGSTPQAASKTSISSHAAGTASTGTPSVRGASELDRTALSKEGGASAVRPVSEHVVASRSALPQLPGASYVPQVGVDFPVRISIEQHKAFWQEPTFWVSVAALIFSVVTLVINYRASNSKEAKARRQSINDEFWLRKVVFPLSIEPAITYYSSLKATLPPDRFTVGATPTEMSLFNDAFSKEQALLRSKNVAVTTISDPLAKAIAVQQEAIEDAIANYCGANSAGYAPLDNPGVQLRADALKQVSDALLVILEQIKKHQEAIA